ncbi:MAG TPA: lipid A export permease/ATP-binding protein MsbA [Burkholderiales bacterium]|nr:lipid A export permease/ATP-binding protein MsbA [Burkholderiales bacterium]
MFDSLTLYRRLLSYARPYLRVFFASVFGMVLIAMTQPAIPALMKSLLDGSFVDKDPTLIQLMPLAIIVIMLVHGIGSFLSEYCASWVGNKVVLDLRDSLFRKLVQLPTSYFENVSSGNVISKLTFDVAQVAAAATNVLTVLIKDGLTILGLICWLLYLNWKLTLIALSFAPPIVLIIVIASRRLRAMSRQAQDAMGEITRVLQEATEAHKVVKVFGGQDYETRRFFVRANSLRRYLMKQEQTSALSWPIVQLVTALGLAVIVYLAILQSQAAETTVGGFVSFVVASLMLTPPLKRLTKINEHLQRGLAASESVFRVLDEEPEPDLGGIVLPYARGELRFDRVSFSYGNPDSSALNDISLAIKPGETVALVGPSGSGKTTLVNLIPRFYHPTTGRISLDGHDLESLELKSLRANVALVSQEVILFDDTVAANIAYGVLGDTSESDIIAAAKAAHAWEFIQDMPEGLRTLVGENGVKLSGGQRQRIAIARAFLKNAPVLILDEATSALDTESERHVQAALEELLQGRTTIVIAHRLSTVEKAGRIVVLDKGRIAEVGSHRDLLQKNGLYAQLYRVQFELGAEEAPESERRGARSVA